MSAEMNNFNREIELLKKLKQAEVLNSGRKEQLKQSIIRQIQIAEPQADLKVVRSSRIFSVIRYTITTAVGISLVAGTAFASNSAKPGDPLFPVKKLKENIQITLTPTEQGKATLEAQIAQDRLNALMEIKHQDGDSNKSEQTQNQTPVQQPTGNDQSSNGSNGSATTPTVVNPTPQTNQDHGQNDNRENKAAQELTEAVNHLRQTQQKLLKKGNTQAAASIDNTILELQQKSQLNLGAKDADEQRDGGEDHGDKDHSNQTTQTQNQGTTLNTNGTNNTGSHGSSKHRKESSSQHQQSQSDDQNIQSGPISPEPLIPINPTVVPDPTQTQTPTIAPQDSTQTTTPSTDNTNPEVNPEHQTQTDTTTNSNSSSTTTSGSDDATKTDSTTTSTTTTTSGSTTNNTSTTTTTTGSTGSGQTSTSTTGGGSGH